jgi:photosystem II stability/assembly factor-like uncharacterized protein
VSFDEHDLRRALEARSGEPSPDLRSRLRQAVTRAPRGAAGGNSWLAAVAVIVVTVLTATSVGVLVVGRHARNAGSASGARVASPSPPSTGPASNVQLSAHIKSVVWALVDYKALYLSSDEGDHWSQRSLPANPGIRPSMSFLNSSEGWLLAPGSPATQCGQQGAVIWHTTDGAATWHQLETAGLSQSQCKESIVFTDVGHGFVTAWDDNHRPTVYWSNDGGVGWKSSTLPDNPLFVTGAGGFTLRVGWIKGFGSDLYLEASGAQHDPIYPRDFIYTSTDGGATWTWKQKLGSPYTYMVTELRWLQLAPDVMESVNGGQAFAPFATDLKVTPPFKAYFVNVFLGYVVAGTVVQRTADGGAHWTSVATPWSPAVVASPSPTPTPSQIPMPNDAELSAPSSTVVWALVAGQYLFRSTDQGTTWDKRSTPPTPVNGGSPLIAFVDATTGWELVPTSGDAQCKQEAAETWQTTDGAATWKLVSRTHPDPSPYGYLPDDRCKDALFFSDATNGYLTLGDPTFQPELFRTTDGGATWQGWGLMGSPATTTLPRRVFTMRAFGDAILGEARYDALSYVYLGPGYWVKAPDNATSNVAFLTATHWLILQPSALETTNAGKSWHSFATNYSDAAGVASVVVFADENVGYATVRGDIRRTLDGGAHWELIKTSWP